MQVEPRVQSKVLRTFHVSRATKVSGGPPKPEKQYHKEGGDKAQGGSREECIGVYKMYGDHTRRYDLGLQVGRDLRQNPGIAL